MLKTISKASPIPLLLRISLLFCAPASSQLMKFEAPLNQLDQNGLKSLYLGDSLGAYQKIQSAHIFEPTNLDIAFHYHLLSVALDKVNAISSAENWLKNNTNKIYHSRLNFELAKYYFKKQQVESAIQAYKKLSIDDLESLTGYNFLSNVPSAIQKSLESHKDTGPTLKVSNLGN